MTARKVRCPQCSGEAIYSPENPWRPFCSERCKQIDLGAWADESYRIPVVGDPNDLDSDLPTSPA
jgi:endogenous inhibitor of DNA gyrase (YacG/DUF329 family)